MVYNFTLSRFYVPTEAWFADISITKCKIGGRIYDQRCPVEVSASPLSVPVMSTDKNENSVRVSCDQVPADQCHLTLATMADTDHYLTITNSNSSPGPVSLAVSIQLSGCRDESFTDGAMMVNSINTELLCSENNR